MNNYVKSNYEKQNKQKNLSKPKIAPKAFIRLADPLTGEDTEKNKRILRLGRYRYTEPIKPNFNSNLDLAIHLYIYGFSKCKSHELWNYAKNHKVKGKTADPVKVKNAFNDAKAKGRIFIKGDYLIREIKFGVIKKYKIKK